MQDKKEKTQADLDNYSNQLNPNNPEYGKSRNNLSKPVTEIEKQNSISKDNNAVSNEKLNP